MTEPQRTDSTSLSAFWLPGLAGSGLAVPSLAGVASLDAGIPKRLWEEGSDGATTFRPEDLPVSEREMSALVESIRTLVRDNARETGSDAMGQAVRARLEEEERERVTAETKAVEALAGSAPDEGEALAQLRRQVATRAQSTLAWMWVQETLVAEMDRLVGSVDHGMGSLDATIGAEGMDMGLRTGTRIARGGGLGVSEEKEALLARWRLILENMLPLVPAGSVFVFSALPKDAADLMKEAGAVPFGGLSGTAASVAEIPSAHVLSRRGARLVERGVLPSAVRLVALGTPDTL